ncbi:MAG: alpha/beta hydrolase family protein [Candidatus Cyclobacteriaceae bacterium M2_1C_046]
MRNYFYFIALSFIALFSCSGDELLIEEPALVEYSNILNYGTNEAKMAFSAIDMDTVHPDVQHKFKVYEVTYKTSYNENVINATALVAVPTTTASIPLLSFQHGTIVAHDEAPSKNLFNQLPLFSLASTGYVVVIPDYIGFGASEDYFHPYYVAEAMGESIYDAIKATTEMLVELGVNFNGDVFLTGYSEGGFATMATHKYMEENTTLPVKVSAPASGGYDVKGMQEWYFGLESYDQPFYMAFVALAYKNYYGWDQDLGLFFQEPYASKLEGLFDGTNSGSQINQELTDVVADFLQPDAIQNFDTSADFADMANALKDNSLTNWTPVAPVIMYHGTADVTVPYQNSVDSYEALIALPGNADKFEFVPIEGGTHYTGALPYIKDVYFRFKALK